MNMILSGELEVFFIFRCRRRCRRRGAAHQPADGALSLPDTLPSMYPFYASIGNKLILVFE